MQNETYEEALDTATQRILCLELRAMPELANCPNNEHVARWITQSYNYGPNAETGIIQPHLDAERHHPSTLDLASIVRIMIDDPETAHLCRPVQAWERPAENPWLDGASWNLTSQGQVFRNDPELAARWKHQADTVRAQRVARG